MNFDDDNMSLNELRDIVSQGGKRDEPVHVNPQEEHILKSLGNPGAIDTPLADYGRNGDTNIVLVNPKEQKALKKLGGSGTVNPQTGLVEYAEIATAQIGKETKPVTQYGIYYTPEYKAWLEAKRKQESGWGYIAGSFVSDIFGGKNTWVGKLAMNIGMQFDKDPLWFAAKMVLSTATWVPKWAMPVANVVYDTVQYDKDLPFNKALGKALGNAGTSYLATKAGEWATGGTKIGEYQLNNPLYQEYISGPISKALENYSLETNKAWQSIAASTTYGATSSLTKATLTGSKDPWGDMLKGGLAGGVTAGSSELVKYLTKDTNNAFLQSNTFKNAASTAVASKLLKRDEKETTAALSQSLLSMFEKYLKDNASSEKRTKLEAKQAEQQKAKAELDNYAKTTIQPLYDKQTEQVAVLETPQLIESSLETYNKRLDDIIYWSTSRGGNIIDRLQAEQALETGSVFFTDPSLEKEFFSAASILNNDFVPLYRSGQYEKDIDAAAANVASLQEQLEATREPYANYYLNFAKLDADLSVIGSEFIKEEQRNAAIASNLFNSAVLYKDTLGIDLTPEKFEALQSKVDFASDPYAFDKKMYEFTAEDYKAATGKNLTTKHWDAVLDPSVPRLSEDEIKAIYAEEGIYNPTQAEIDKYAYDTKSSTYANRYAIDSSYQSQQEIRDYFKQNIGRPPTDAEVKEFLGDADQEARNQLYKLDASETSEQEALSILTQQGEAPTQERIKALIASGDEKKAAARAIELDAGETTEKEVTDYFTKEIGRAPTAEEINEFLTQAEAESIEDMLAIDKAEINKQEAIQFFRSQGVYSPTEQQIAALLSSDDETAAQALAKDIDASDTDYYDAAAMLSKKGIYNPSQKLVDALMGVPEYESQAVLDILERGGLTSSSQVDVLADKLKEIYETDPDLTKDLKGRGFNERQYKKESGSDLTSRADLYTDYLLRGKDAGYDFYTEDQEINADEARQALQNAGVINPTQEMIDGLTGKGYSVNKYSALNDAKVVADPYVLDYSEAVKAFKEVSGGVAPTSTQEKALLAYVNQGKTSADPNNEANFVNAVYDYADPIFTTEQEVKDRFAQYGLTPTDADIRSFTGTTEAKSLPRIDKFVDPLYTERDEAIAAFTKSYGRAPTAGEQSKIDSFVGPQPESGLPKYINDYFVVPDAKEKFQDMFGREPTEAEIKAITYGTTEAKRQAAFTKYTDPYYTDQTEAKAAFFKLFGRDPNADEQAKIDSFVGPQPESGLTTFITDNFVIPSADDKFKDMFGREPTAAERAAITRGKTEAARQAAFNKFVDPMYTDKDEVDAAVKKILGAGATEDILEKYRDQFVGATNEKTQLGNISTDIKNYYITPKEFSSAFKSRYGIVPTQDTIDKYIGYNDEVDKTNRFGAFFEELDPLITTKAELRQKFADYGIKPTAADYTKFMGYNPDANLDAYLGTQGISAAKAAKDAQDKADAEYRAAVAKAKAANTFLSLTGRNPTSDELEDIVAIVETKQKDIEAQISIDKRNAALKYFESEFGRKPTPDESADIFEATLLATKAKNVDLAYTDKDEVETEIKNILGDAATPEILKKYEDQFVGPTDERIQFSKIAADINKYSLTQEEVVDAFQSRYGRNIDPSQDVIDKYVGYNAGIDETNRLGAFFEELDPLITTKAELNQKFADYGLTPRASDYIKYAGYNPDAELDKYLSTKYPTGTAPPDVYTYDDRGRTYLNDELQFDGYEVDFSKPGKYETDNEGNIFRDGNLIFQVNTDETAPTIYYDPTQVKPINYKPSTDTGTDTGTGTTPGPVTPKDVYTEDEAGNIYKNGVLYRASESVYTEDEAGNIYKNGVLYRAAEKPEPPVEPPPVTPPVTPPVEPPPVTPKDVYTEDEAGNVYKNGVLYRAAEKEEENKPEDVYTYDSLGNIYKNGVFFRAAEKIEEETPVTPPVTPPVEPPPVTPPVTPPTEETGGTLDEVEVIASPEEFDYTYDEAGNLYRDGELYRANAFGDIYEEDEYTTDSLGNIFKNGTLYRTKESANGGDVPVYDPAKAKPIIYKSATPRPKKPPPPPPPPPPPKTPTTPVSFDPTAFLPTSYVPPYTPQKAKVVEESPYFDMRKKFDPGMFGSYNPMTMYGSPSSTNTRTNQSKVATMATGGYLDEKPMDMQEILNILERG
jgi:hypothetical protein